MSEGFNTYYKHEVSDYHKELDSFGTTKGLLKQVWYYQLRRARKERKKLEAQLKQKDEIIEKLKNGLGFYGDPEGWDEVECYCMSERMTFKDDEDSDTPIEGKPYTWKGGKRARQTLKEVKEMEG